MRRLISFPCEGETLVGTLDAGDGDRGLLLVTGGSQTRIGSHRIYERLAKSLSEQGISCFRFDRRGVGDSSGEDPGFLGSAPDIHAAAAAFRHSAPNVDRMFGFGLCDGASALALFGGDCRLDGIVMVNPWLVEAAADAPPPAAIKDHYRRRLLSREGWKKLASGSVDIRKVYKGLLSILRPPPQTGLAADVASSLDRSRLTTEVVLAEADATAVAAAAELDKPVFRGRIACVRRLQTDSHTFARPGDEASLAGAVTDAIDRLAAISR